MNSKYNLFERFTTVLMLYKFLSSVQIFYIFVDVESIYVNKNNKRNVPKLPSNFSLKNNYMFFLYIQLTYIVLIQI